MDSWIVAAYCCGEYNVQRFTDSEEAWDYYENELIGADNDRMVYIAKVESDNRAAVHQKWAKEVRELTEST